MNSTLEWHAIADGYPPETPVDELICLWDGTQVSMGYVDQGLLHWDCGTYAVGITHWAVPTGPELTNREMSALTHAAEAVNGKWRHGMPAEEGYYLVVDGNGRPHLCEFDEQRGVLFLADATAATQLPGRCAWHQRVRLPNA